MFIVGNSVEVTQVNFFLPNYLSTVVIEQIRTRFRTKIEKYFSTCENPENLHRNLGIK